MTRQDTWSNTEAAAAHAAARIGASEAITDDAPPVTTPFCSACQRGTGAYLCGPCLREAAEAEEERAVRESRDAEWWAS